jgi:hypothetical protein
MTEEVSTAPKRRRKAGHTGGNARAMVVAARRLQRLHRLRRRRLRLRRLRPLNQPLSKLRGGLRPGKFLPPRRLTVRSLRWRTSTAFLCPHPPVLGTSVCRLGGYKVGAVVTSKFSKRKQFSFCTASPPLLPGRGFRAAREGFHQSPPHPVALPKFESPPQGNSRCHFPKTRLLQPNFLIPPLTKEGVLGCLGGLPPIPPLSGCPVRISEFPPGGLSSNPPSPPSSGSLLGGEG